MKNSIRNLIDYLENRPRTLISLLFIVILNTFTLMITSNILIVLASFTVIVAAFLALSTVDEEY